MNMVDELNNCSDEQIESIVSDRIAEVSQKSEDKELGFMAGAILHKPHRGFISLNSRIKFCSNTLGVDSYSMNATDYMVDFCKYLKENGLSSKGNVINNLSVFSDWYFGALLKHEDVRSDYLTSLCTLDEEGFPNDEEAKHISISDFKNREIAQCTEKAALTQELLSLFGFDSYYCCGGLDYDGNKEVHAFNIVVGKNKAGEEQYRIVDSSMPVIIYKNGNEISRSPYIANIPSEDIEAVLDGKKTFESQNYSIRDGKQVFDGYRIYGVNMQPEELERGKKYLSRDEDR